MFIFRNSQRISYINTWQQSNEKDTIPINKNWAIEYVLP